MRSLTRALGVGGAGVTAFVGAGGKSSAIRRLLAERPGALATTTTHLEPSGFTTGLLLVFPDAGSLPPARSLPAARPLTVAVGDGPKLQAPPLHWLAAWWREAPRARVLVEADGAARRLLKLPAAHEPAWPPETRRVVIVVGLAALGRPLAAVAHHPERFGHAGATRVADVRRMLDAYLERVPPQAAITVLLTGTAAVRADTLTRLVRHVERRVRQRDARLRDPNVPLRVVAAADIDSRDLQVWDCGRGRRVHRVALPGVCAVLLAAGEGRRFGPAAGGATKLLQVWRGKPLVAHAAEHLVNAGCAALVVVVGRDARVANVVRRVARRHGVRARFVRNRDPGRGLASSVRAAARAAPRGFSLLFAHADMPRLRVTTLRQIARTGTTLGHCIVQPVVRGTPRNPVLFPPALRAELERVRGATGGKSVIRRHPGRLFPLAFDPGDDLVDVDRRTDLRRLRTAGVASAPSTRRRRGWRTRGAILLLGGGDLGSGVVEALVRAGFGVVVAERRRPLAVRRRVAFAEAARSGETVVQGIRCRRVPLAALARNSWPRGVVPLVVESWRRVCDLMHPSIVVDARMTKRPARGLPPQALCIALGPGHTAGGDCDAVVETVRGADLGRVLWQGQAMADTGVPGEVGGATTARLLRAPATGRLRVHADIGSRVRRGRVLASVGRHLVRARTSGVVRGMLPDGERVRRGQKLGDIDPRRHQPPVDAISDKARAIGQGVLAAVRQSLPAPSAKRRGAPLRRRLRRMAR